MDDRGRVRAALLAACLAMIVVACGPARGTPAPTDAPATVAPSVNASVAPASDTSSPAAVAPVSPIAGIVIGVDSTAAGQVTGFTLRTNLGETYRFKIGQLQNADEFPPSNLKDSMDTSAPVLVFFDVVNAELVVNRIEGAG
jgi:hypothetical protein